MDKGNANIVTGSFDRIGGSPDAPIPQLVQSFRIINKGGNLVQGQINRISLTEVSMQYDTPTIIYNKNDTLVLRIWNISAGGVWDFVNDEFFSLGQGWYGGQELVDLLNGLTSAEGNPMSDYIEWRWSPDTYGSSCIGCITAETQSTFDGGGIAVELLPYYYLNPNDFVESDPEKQKNALSYPNALWTVGFRNLFSQPPVSWPTTQGLENLFPTLTPNGMPIAYRPSNGFLFICGSVYTGRYTEYIDIISTSLCQNQYVRDSTTTQATHRRDVIARIYVCNNISLPTSDASGNTEGSRPFHIYRAFNPTKVMKWTVERSVDAIDLALFDMYGQPLPDIQVINRNQSVFQGQPAFCGQGDYAITLHVHEPGAEEQLSNNGYRM